MSAVARRAEEKNGWSSSVGIFEQVRLLRSNEPKPTSQKVKGEHPKENRGNCDGGKNKESESSPKPLVRVSEKKHGAHRSVGHAGEKKKRVKKENHDSQLSCETARGRIVTQS